MISNLRGLLAASFIAVLCTGAAANAQQYQCAVQSEDNIVPPAFLIQYSGSTATISHNWIGGPYVTQVTVRGSGNRARLNYTITGVEGFGAARADLAFRLSHNRANNSLSVRIEPVGYSNRFSGSGACQAG